MNKEFTRVRSTNNIIISLSLTLAGGLLVALPTSVSVNIAGYFLAFAGILLLVILKTGYRDTETKENYCKKEMYFPHECKSGILSCMEDRKIEAIDLSAEDKGNGLRLDIYYNKKNNKAFVSLFEYIPYKYEEASPILEYNTDRISKLIK